MNAEFHEQNRLSWNHATVQHHSHKPDMVEEYANGFNNLFPEETALLGDIGGRSVLHLQCNDGQDTVSIARHLRARPVLGVDISDVAVELAQKLAAGARADVEFERADIFTWFDNFGRESEHAEHQLFDVVYTGYGAIGWLSSLKEWARGIARVLKPGGRFVMIEFHPLALMFDEQFNLKYDYQGGTHVVEDGVSDYVGEDFKGEYKNPHKSHEFCWGVGDVVSSLLGAGLVLDHLEEYPFINGWKQFPTMISGEGRRHYLPKDKPKFALMFSVVAHKPTR